MFIVTVYLGIGRASRGLKFMDFGCSQYEVETNRLEKA